MKKSRDTASKKEVLSILTEAAKALTHAEIYEKAQHTCDRVTVYRILDRYISEGIVHRIALADGTLKYALCDTCKEGHHVHSHVHFHCIACGSVTCTEIVIPPIRLPRKYTVHELNLLATGICDSCK